MSEPLTPAVLARALDRYDREVDGMDAPYMDVRDHHHAIVHGWIDLARLALLIREEMRA